MLLKETSNKINGSRKGLAYLVAAGVEEAGVHRDGALGAVADHDGVQDVRGLLRLLPLVLAASSSASRMCEQDVLPLVSLDGMRRRG
jgi:hypothetical protein